MKKLLVVEAAAEAGLGKVVIAIVVVGEEGSTQSSPGHPVTAFDNLPTPTPFPSPPPTAPAVARPNDALCFPGQFRRVHANETVSAAGKMSYQQTGRQRNYVPPIQNIPPCPRYSTRPLVNKRAFRCRRCQRPFSMTHTLTNKRPIIPSEFLLLLRVTADGS